MKSVTYFIHDFVEINARVGPRLAKVLNDNFKTFERYQKVDYQIKLKEVNNSDYDIFTRSLGSLHKVSYHRYQGTFIYSQNEQQIWLHNIDFNSNEILIEATSGINEATLILILEYFIRIAAMEKNVLLVHAGCTADGNGAELYLGWAGTGKTSFVLQKVAEGNYYLAEDRVWMGNSTVYSYPRYIRINQSNAHLFRSELSLKGKLKFYIFGYVNYMTSSVKFLDKFNHIITKILSVSEKVNLTKFVSAKQITQSAPLRKIHLLEKSKLPLESYDIETLIEIFENISYYEWNNELLKLASAFDILFRGEKQFTRRVEKLLQDEKHVFTKNVDQISLHYERRPFTQSLRK